MLTFEALLVKELQKQQSRAEFCDIVLQTQGVSVPVHSCVLSAFSPWLCGALSAMPSPRNGQRRLIEVQTVEACTLLSLVGLLYSGQFKEDKEEVLSAACKLGISIPQRDRKKQATERNTQTEWTKEVAERESQTETLPSECQNTTGTVSLTGPSLWRSDQGLCAYTDGCDISQNAEGNRENGPSLQVMDAGPESVVYPSVSGPACLPQVYVCPPAASYLQPLIPVSSYPQPSAEPFAGQAESAVSEGEECVLEAFARFENNIPGFINHFLDANASQGAGQREESRRRDVKTEGGARRGRRAGVRGGFSLKGESLKICKRQQNVNRCGRVAGLVWTGQGGGRVGRTLDTRQVFKNQGRRKRQGGGAMKEERGRGRSSSRARQRGAGSRGRLVVPAGQDTAPPPRRRGRPRKNPLPQPTVSQNSSGPSPPEQKTINPPAPSLMHTAALPAAGLAPPMDWLIDDVIAQLPFMPNHQSGVPNAVAVDHSRTQSTVKLTDVGIVQPQSEGELTDILDSFLRTFEQHVGTCDSDVQDGTVPDVTDGSQTCRQSAQDYTSNAHGSSRNTTAQGSKISLSKNRPQAAGRPQKPLGYWQVPGVKMEKSAGQQGEEMPGRITRSQSRKRKLEVVEELPGRDHLPAKQRKKRKRKQKDEPNQLNGEPVCTSSALDPSGGVRSALRKVINNVKSADTLPSPDRSKSSQLQETSLVKKSRARHVERDATEPLLEGSTLTTSCSTASSQPKSMTKSKTTGSRPALSAFEMVKKILENQQKREEEQTNHKMWAVQKQKGKERLKKKRACGAEAKMAYKREKDGGIRDEGHGHCGINQEDEEMRWRRNEADNQMTSASAKDHTASNGERLTENSYNKARLETADSTSASPFHRCSTDTTDVPFASQALDATTPLEELGNTPLSADSSDEDVDVVEVSSSLSESFAVLPITDIVLSTEEDEDSDENQEIDVISLGSN